MIFIVIAENNIYWTKKLLEMDFTVTNAIAGWVLFFFLYLNQNGNEKWWPSIACLNQLKQAQFVILLLRKKSHLSSSFCVVQCIIQTEMKVRCLHLSLVNDALLLLCFDNIISHQKQENIYGIYAEVHFN